MKFKVTSESTGKFFVNTFKKGGKQYGKRFYTEQEATEFALITGESDYTTLTDITC